MSTEKRGAVGKEVRYEFSDEEKAALANDMTESISKISDLEAAKSAAASSYGVQIKEAKATLAKQARAHREGFEMRNVACQVEYDYESATVAYIRTDNGEVAETRTMSADERQLYFNDKCARCGEEFRVTDMVEVDGDRICQGCIENDDPQEQAVNAPSEARPEKFVCCDCGSTLPWSDCAAETEAGPICKLCDKAGAEGTE